MGKLVIGGVINDSTIDSTSIIVNVPIDNSTGEPGVEIDGFCLSLTNTTCATLAGAGRYIIDTFSPIIRLPSEAMPDKVDIPPSFTNQSITYDSATNESMQLLPCDMYFLESVSVVINATSFTFAKEDTVVEVAEGVCVSALQPLRDGKEARLGWPFLRNVVLGVDLRGGEGMFEVRQRVLPS